MCEADEENSEALFNESNYGLQFCSLEKLASPIKINKEFIFCGPTNLVVNLLAVRVINVTFLSSGG
jgi:hypothetical protein